MIDLATNSTSCVMAAFGDKWIPPAIREFADSGPWFSLLGQALILLVMAVIALIHIRKDPELKPGYKKMAWVYIGYCVLFDILIEIGVATGQLPRQTIGPPPFDSVYFLCVLALIGILAAALLCWIQFGKGAEFLIRHSAWSLHAAARISPTKFRYLTLILLVLWVLASAAMALGWLDGLEQMLEP